MRKFFFIPLLFSLFCLGKGGAAASKVVGSRVEQTLTMIKPDAVRADHIGDIVSIFEKNGLKVVAIQMTQLSRQRAELFYQEHKKRTFFPDLVSYMSSGPIVAMVLEGPNVVAEARRLIGATNPKEADPDTIRALYGASVDRNAVHGSDSIESAQREVAFFFAIDEIYTR